MEMKDPLNLPFIPRPGIVYFFTEGDIDSRDDSLWKHYVARLDMAMRRRGMEVMMLEAPRPDLIHTTLARLFNLGNILSVAYAWISGNAGPTGATSAIERLADLLVWVEDWKKGSVDLTPHNFDFFASPIYPKSARVKQVSACIDNDGDNGCCDSVPCACEENEPLRVEDEDFLDSLDSERRDIINRIGMLVAEYVRQYHEMPPLDMLGKATRGLFLVAADNSVQFSPVVVNGNLDILLPDYNELTLRFTPLLKIIYILFLLHPEGIRLKDISDYRHELEDIYLLVKPGADAKLAASSIDSICTPGSESLNQKISMIKRAVKMQLNVPSLVEHFTISGSRGLVYRLPASGENHVQLPAALMKYRKVS
ncbi:MAG: hypothetical protein NC082_02350 [Clostridiales bacterium]|nr:hypothetical protein [Clostridiales bacterium]